MSKQQHVTAIVATCNNNNNFLNNKNVRHQQVTTTYNNNVIEIGMHHKLIVKYNIQHHANSAGDNQNTCYDNRENTFRQLHKQKH